MGDPGFSSFFLSSTTDKPPLRIGILLEHRLDRATAAILEDLRAADFVTPVIVLFDAGPVDPATAGSTASPGGRWLERLRRAVPASRERWGRLAWDLYTELDRRRVTLADDPVGPVDRAAALQGLDARPVRLVRDGAVRRLPAGALDQLRTASLDVILQLGLDDVRGHFDIGSYGCWALRHGDGDRYAGDPPHAWEIVEGSPVTGVTLERRAGTPAETLVLASAQFATDTGSLVRNRVMPYFGSTFLVVRKLWELHRFGWQRLVEQSRPAGPAASGHGAVGIPPNRVVVRWLLPRVLGSVRRRLAGRLRSRDEIEHWQMAIRVGGPRLDPEGAGDLPGFRVIESPKGRFYADPFLVERDGRTWLYFEDYGYAERRGVISCAEVAADGRLGPARVVLSTEGHLSYPYVFLDGEEAWMIPESSAQGAVRLYRATDFPFEWVEHAEILPRPALDSSIWQQAGRWWLFTSLREPRGGATMLWLLHAESLSGPWVAHPMNPISADVRTARSAGLIHRHGERLLRPSQDGSRGYGSSFSLNAITILSPTAYEERELVTVGPDWAPRMVATHTYNRSGPFEVTDGKFRRPRRDVQ